MSRTAARRRPRASLSRAIPALLLTILVAGATATSAAAWTNGAGDGYETHDWIVDQALRVLDGKVDGWFDRDTALRATDDPDHIEVAADPSRSIEHMYREAGVRGGAVHRVAEHYAA